MRAAHERLSEKRCGVSVWHGDRGRPLAVTSLIPYPWRMSRAVVPHRVADGCLDNISCIYYIMYLACITAIVNTHFVGQKTRHTPGLGVHIWYLTIRVVCFLCVMGGHPCRVFPLRHGWPSVSTTTPDEAAKQST